MKNYSNIYDIDGELIRAAGDTHKFTLEEAQERLEKYKNKLKELLEIDENDPKIPVYDTYVNNLTRYIWNLYATMPQEQFKALVERENNNKTTAEQIEKAINELKEDLNDAETGTDTENKVQGSTTGDSTSSTNGELRDDKTIEQDLSNVHEEGPTTQSDLLVERTDVNTVMDEYIQFEEI